MYADRRSLYLELERLRDSKVFAFVTGDRRGWETQIHPEIMDFFVSHLDALGGDVKRISLLLYSNGGSILAAWSIVNLINQFCDELEVIVPSKALSAATLICLGAGKIVMTKQARLGPIDPSVNTPLCPQVPGGPPGARLPVSVEAIKGFVELAKQEVGIADSGLPSVLAALSNQVHPLVLGEAFRARGQIRSLAKKLLRRQMDDEDKIEKIIDFLCSESGSHDYTINRREARDELGLSVDKPNDELYSLIRLLYDDISRELALTTPFDPMGLLGTSPQIAYCNRRALIESLAGGCDYFSSEGMLTRQQVPTGPPGQPPQALVTTAQDQRTFEGWRHENAI